MLSVPYPGHEIKRQQTNTVHTQRTSQARMVIGIPNLTKSETTSNRSPVSGSRPMP